MDADAFAQIVERIIKAQEAVIGPLAIEQAKEVSGLKIDLSTNEITISGDKKKVINDLVKQYEYLFGRASIEVCKNAIKGFLPEIPKDQVPSSLA